MTNPGIHPNFDFGHYSPEEAKIIHGLSVEWYITSHTAPIRVSETSIYRALLCKPTASYCEMFNLEREVVLLFSSYEDFEPRTIDGFEIASGRWEALRIDPICRILISKDRLVIEKTRNILKNDPELPIIVPFSYEEMTFKSDSFLMRNRFKEHFFSRDLFAFESPLKKETYFFGRNDLINGILSRHRSNENSALFGLRRSGKTSIVFGLERASKLARQNFVSIDCQSPSVHKRRWNQLLAYVLDEIVKKYQLKKSLIKCDLYTEVNASDQFYDDIKNLYILLQRKSILISFDEIERISFKTGSSEHWASGEDFVLFWQAIRSAFQRHNAVFSFILIGTNPQCTEIPFVANHDNPLFNSVPIDYIPGFDVKQTREMVRKLGRYMGLVFDESLYSRLHDDFGGHPYLIRHVCSLLHKNAPKARPIKVDKTLYIKSKIEFLENYANYTEMILEVLIRDYPDEYVMLSALANEDIELFNEFSQDRLLTNHLRGYGLVDHGLEGYYFKIESVKDHLRRKTRFKSKIKTEAEKLNEISARRAVIEPAFRRIIATIFQANFGKRAKLEAEKLLSGQSLARLQISSFHDVFAPNSIDTNLSELTKIIVKKWDIFKNMFDIQIIEFEFHMEIIRKGRTQESHSGMISDKEFDQLRISFTKIEEELENAGFYRSL